MDRSSHIAASLCAVVLTIGLIGIAWHVRKLDDQMADLQKQLNKHDIQIEILDRNLKKD